MSTSSVPPSVPGRRRHSGAALLPPAGLILVLVATAAGCSRFAARPPEPPAAQRAVVSRQGAEAPGASVGTTVIGGGSTVAPSPPEPPNRDPGEEITPEELAAISEPVPGSTKVPGGAGPGTPPGTLQGSPQARSARSESTLRRPTSIWRVQIFVTQDRDLADRKGREAAERLQVKAHVAYEPPYYKVRLGDYASEAEAQSLREKALYTGYPGAFRVRCGQDTSHNLD